MSNTFLEYKYLMLMYGAMSTRFKTNVGVNQADSMNIYKWLLINLDNNNVNNEERIHANIAFFAMLKVINQNIAALICQRSAVFQASDCFDGLAYEESSYDNNAHAGIKRARLAL